MRSVGCVIRDGPIACVMYAAKSTEDRRGSIPGQLRECREAVESAGGRRIVGEYSDEAFSAFVGSRGPGLAEAMRHAQELARDGTVELWAQHSDRLARGDGRSARHAVEVALWALKNDVRVRTIPELSLAHCQAACAPPPYTVSAAIVGTATATGPFTSVVRRLLWAGCESILGAGRTVASRPGRESQC